MLFFSGKEREDKLMKHLASSCAIAFSTYSRIPMPQVEWSEENMRHTLAFFPLVGAAVGAAFWGADADRKSVV